MRHRNLPDGSLDKVTRECSRDLLNKATQQPNS